MRNPQLKLMDLVLGLERFGDRYEAIDVFADDVLEARSTEPVRGLCALGPDEGQRFRFTVPEGKPHEGESYALELFPDAGIVRMSRATPALPVALAPSGRGGLAGLPATTAVNAARRKRGEGAVEGLILGLLTGTLKNRKKTDAPQRVFTLRFDPSIGQWRAYDGGLVPWMKEQLLPRSA